MPTIQNEPKNPQQYDVEGFNVLIKSLINGGRSRLKIQNEPTNLQQYSAEKEEKIPPPYGQFISTFTQTAAKMRALGKVLIGLGAVLAIGAIGGGIGSIHHPALAIVISVTCGVGTITALPISAYLLKKSYWRDPAFRRTKQNEIVAFLKNEGYNAAREKYRNPQAKPEEEFEWNSHQLISKKEIASILQEKWQKKGYLEIKNDIKCLVDDGIFERSYFTEKLLNESADLSFSEFIEKYGWEPFEYKIVSKDDKAVVKAFKIYLKTTELTKFFESYYKNAKKHQIIPSDWSEQIDKEKRTYNVGHDPMRWLTIDGEYNYAINGARDEWKEKRKGPEGRYYHAELGPPAEKALEEFLEVDGQAKEKYEAVEKKARAKKEQAETGVEKSLLEGDSNINKRWKAWLGSWERGPAS